VVWIYWRTPEEWAAQIDGWVESTAQRGGVLTLYELREGDGTRGAGMFFFFFFSSNRRCGLRWSRSLPHRDIETGTLAHLKLAILLDTRLTLQNSTASSQNSSKKPSACSSKGARRRSLAMRTRRASSSFDLETLQSGLLSTSYIILPGHMFVTTSPRLNCMGRVLHSHTVTVPSPWTKFKIRYCYRIHTSMSGKIYKYAETPPAPVSLPINNTHHPLRYQFLDRNRLSKVNSCRIATSSNQSGVTIRGSMCPSCAIFSNLDQSAFSVGSAADNK